MTPENDRESTAEEEARHDAHDDARPEDGPVGESGGATREADEPGPGGAQASGAANGADDAIVVDGVSGADHGQDDDQDDGTSETSEEPSLEERLAVAERLATTNFERVQRLQAEMENQRKRAQRDVANARKFALDAIAGDLLPVKDSLELGIRAASAEEASLSSLLEGSELTLKMLTQVLEKNAIVEIDPEGEKFDPEFHQAMSMQEVEGVAPNIVTGVMQKGYTLNERLLRPALVMVSK